MQLAFPTTSNRDIDRLLGIAEEHMVSHLIGRTLYVTAFRLEEEEEEDEQLEADEEYASVDFQESLPPTPFQPLPRSTPLPLAAVDSGVAELGRLSGGGLAVAIRASVFVQRGDGRPLLLRYDTGGIVFDEGNRLPLFHFIGRRLGFESLFVEVLEDGLIKLTDKTPIYANEVKNAVRSFVERMATEEAISVLEGLGGGTLLLDGALPPSSFDLPHDYVMSMLEACARKGVDVAAISKKTRHTVHGRPIEALFDDEPTFVGYAPIREAVDSMRARRAGAGTFRTISAAAEVFAARFGIGPTALTFRVDVHNSQCSTPSEVIERIYTGIPLYGGYPMPLIHAHHCSSFIGLDGPGLAGDLVARYGFRFEPERTMDVLFAPFNAFGK